MNYIPIETLITAFVGSRDDKWPDNYPALDGHRARMQAYLQHAADLLAKEANNLGFVLTITQQSVGPIPAVGRTINVISVTPKRIEAS